MLISLWSLFGKKSIQICLPDCFKDVKSVISVQRFTATKLQQCLQNGFITRSKFQCKFLSQEDVDKFCDKLPLAFIMIEDQPYDAVERALSGNYLFFSSLCEFDIVISYSPKNTNKRMKS